MSMKLYSYWRSSASYRVRIALNLKGLKADMVPVNLLKGEQKRPDYLAINPQGLLPALLHEGAALNQSLAIMEYLEESFPEPPLLPQGRAERARVRAIAQMIACEIAPLCNLGPAQYLTAQFGANEEQKVAWMHHWMHKGFAAVEAMLREGSGSFCHGGLPTIADCCLIPQVYNARRFALDLSPYPNVIRIAEYCETLPAFLAAHPSVQADAIA